MEVKKKMGFTRLNGAKKPTGGGKGGTEGFRKGVLNLKNPGNPRERGEQKAERVLKTLNGREIRYGGVGFQQ